MVEEFTNGEQQDEETITSTIFCVNTNCAYIYELLHGDIIRERKVVVKA